jgi:hypothetical protein
MEVHFLLLSEAELDEMTNGHTRGRFEISEKYYTLISLIMEFSCWVFSLNPSQFLLTLGSSVYKILLTPGRRTLC